MKIYKYVLLHFVIRYHYSRLNWTFNFSYCWLLRCVTRSRYRPRASFGIPDVGERILPYIWGGGRRPPASHATLTTADRQGVDISFTACGLFVIWCVYVCVCVCVCTVMDFSAEDKVSGVKFCTVVHRRPGQQRQTYWRTLLPRSSKLDEKEPSLTCRPRLTDVRATFYL